MKTTPGTSFYSLDNSIEYLCGVTDTELHFLHTNQLFKKQFGLFNDEYKGKPFNEVVHSFQLEKLLQAKESCINDPEKVICIEIKTIQHNEEHWFRWEMTALRDDQKKITGISFIGTDITHQKKTEQELLQQAILFDNISDAVIATDLNYCIKSWNLSSEMLFGFRPDEVLGRPTTEFFNTRTVHIENEQALQQIFVKGFWKGEAVITKKDGTQIFTRSAVSLIKNAQGKPSGFITINQDISNEKIAKDELNIKKEEFNSFMENTPALAWINDEKGKLFYMNSLFKKTFKLKDNDIGKNIFDFYPAEMKSACKASDELVLHSNESVEVIEEGKNSEGNTIFYKVYKFPVHSAIGDRLVGGQAIDITTETLSQQQLIKEKSQFISFMENAPLMAWIVDAEGITRYMNSLYKISSNFTDDNLGKDNHHLYPASIQQKARESITEVLLKNENIKYQYQYDDESGKTRYFNACKFPIQNLDGKRFVGGQSIEITEMIDTNSQVLKEKIQFESFMENAPLLAWIVDEEGILHYMNSKFKARFNFSDAERHQKFPDDFSAILAAGSPYSNEIILQNNQSVVYQHDWTDHNGKTINYRTYKFPMRSPDGKHLIGGQSEDITDELNAKKELEKMHERFEFAGKATRDVIWDWDFKTNIVKRFGGSNSFFDYSRMGDLMDFKNDNIHPDDAAAAEISLQSAIHSKANRWMCEFRYKFAAGTYKTVIDQAYIIRDKNGKAIRMIGSMQDVTEERRLQKEVMETALRKKQDMLSAVWQTQETERKELSEELHDNVNQLLAASLLFLKTVIKQQQDPGEMISKSIGYLDKAVAEIRQISHSLNPGTLQYNGICIAINELAEGLLIPGKMEVKFYTKNFSEVGVSKELQLALYRIVQEKINNILKHADASKVSIELTENNNTILLTITDNGKGFDLQKTKKGLGLNNIFNRAESFGGKAELTTAPGKGCILTVTIPANT